MLALHGALAAGLLPWPQTRARLALLVAASLAAHLGAVAALPRLMSGVSPGTSAAPSQVLRVALRPSTALQVVAPAAESPSSNAALAPAVPPVVPSQTPAPTVAPSPAARPSPPPSSATPSPSPARAAETASSTGPAVAAVPVAGPPAKGSVQDPKPRQGSELAARDAEGPLSGPRYLQLKEVDQRPAPITHINPVYPPEAGQVEGRVVVRLLISENGGIDRIEIVSADPPGLFERATLDAFGNARYQPALKSNVRVKSQMTFEVRFVREDAPPAPDRLPPPVPTGPPRTGG